MGEALAREKPSQGGLPAHNIPLTVLGECCRLAALIFSPFEGSQFLPCKNTQSPATLADETKLIPINY